MALDKRQPGRLGKVRRITISKDKHQIIRQR